MARFFLAVIAVSLLVLQWQSFAEASHFRYGNINWAPVDSHSNTIKFTFRLAFRRSYSSSYNCDQSTIRSGRLLGSGDSWTANCGNPSCSSTTIADTGFHCTDYSSNEDWSMGENNFTYTFPSIDDEWVVSYTSCCWISLSRYGNGNWLVSASVNLNRRSDNGRLNSSPVSRSPAIVRWQEGCPHSLRISVEDPDGDVVKCRWASYSESSINSDSFPYGTLDEKACVLTYNRGSGTAGIYAVTLTLEDFPAGTTNFSSVSPFCAVGLQFLVIISSNSGSCSNVPVFTASTPDDGECSEVQIGSAYITVIEVKLADFSKHVVEIVTSSPSGMQVTSLRYHGGVYYRNVTWYPNQYQVGQQLFCFKAVDSSNMESEWRCVTILVGLSNTPRVITGSRTPTNPFSKNGPGFIWWSIQFDRVIKKPRTSSYIRLVLLPSGHTVYKVDTLSQYVKINSDHTTLQFAMPNAAVSMNGSYAILIDHGAVVGQGCSYDGPPTPGITNTSDWKFVSDGVCPIGYYLSPPEFTNCIDINECGSPSRSKRSNSCPGNIYAQYYNINFTSPSYPSYYSNNEYCTWTIEAPVGHYVYVYFYEFATESGYDFLYIYDGNSASSPQIIRATGQMAPWSVYSSSRFLFLRFTSDVIIPWKGFAAACRAITQRYFSSHQEPSSISLSQTSTMSISSTPSITPTMSSSYVPFSVSYPGSCSRHISWPYYTNVHSPGYPGCYPNNEVCTWLIETSVGYYIQLYIYVFNLEYGGSHCPWDYLEIRDGDTLSSPLITKACGSLAHTVIYSSGRFLFLRFVSDGVIQMPGFLAWCTTVSQRYGNTIPSVQLSSSASTFCVSSHTPATWFSATSSASISESSTFHFPWTTSPPPITPTMSSSYVPFSVSYPDNRVGFNNSVILGKNAELLANFTNLMKPVVQSGNDWRLCWRASQDGWASSRFHSLCDGKGPTITIIKVGQYIFGGYTSISWSSYCAYRYDSQAYLFSLVNKPGWAPLQLNQTGYYSYYKSHSIYSCSSYGPTFGGGHDIHISSYASSSSSCYSYLGWTYSPPSGYSSFAFTFLAGSYLFTPDEIEIFYDETFSSQAPPFPTSTSLSTIMPVPTTTRRPLASQIAPTSSSSVTSIRYASSSSYALPTPVDFHLNVPADCAQICTNSPGSNSCSCVSGYRLASDGKSCLDIDECATNNGGCSHHCNNIPGSFYCRCPEGTTMAVNNLTCVEPGVSVTCDESNMTVSLEKQSFPFFRVSELHLLYSSCRATQNSTHILISTSLNGCGTLVNETEEELIFWNEIQVDAVIIDNVITRTHDINLPFYCSYSRRKMLSLSFSPRNIFVGSEAGYGNFTMIMDFYKTADFTTPYNGNEYPIEVSLNENLYIMFSVESSADLVIMAENCKATKYGNFYSWPQYNIIQNGCPRDTAMQYTYDPTRSFQHIIIPAFRFFNDYDVVYFHCELLACYRYNSNSRCSNSCLNSKRRKRRDVNRDELKQEESTTKHLLTSGPITKKSENTKKSEKGDTGQSKQAALIGGAAAAGGFGLIAVVAVAVLFVKYRIARRLMNRNKVGDLYTTKEEQMSRKNAYIQEDDMIEKEDSF